MNSCRFLSVVVLRGLLGLVLLLAAGCRPAPDNNAETNAEKPARLALEGSWRAVLASPGGELPFELRVEKVDGSLEAHAVTAGEEAPFSSVEQEGDTVVFHFAWYDSEITATLDEDGQALSGQWRRAGPSGDSVLPFVATRGFDERFLPLEEAGLEPASEAAREALPSVAGDWRVEFSDEDGTEPARGEFTQEGEDVRGTFLTATGDYRFLEGSYEKGVLRLSTFDGAHAFLFTARAREDGTLAGDFYSRDSYHATWEAASIAADVTVLPDGWSEVGLTNDEGRFAFSFPDLEGETLSLDDERFSGKVVLVNIFGSWCPNCNDEAPLLARWYDEHRDQGLEIVGLAYEFSGDPARDRQVVARYAERHGIEYPLLLAGTSDKEDAAATLPDLSAVLSYPTTVFIGRDGKVRAIHSGFSGPGTGEHYERLVAEMEGKIEDLLAEPAP